MSTTVERVTKAIRQNPEGLLLLGAGVALMLRHAASSGSATPQPKRRARTAADHYYDAATDDVAGSADGLASKVSAAAEDVRSYVSETAHDLTDKASEYGHAATKRTREVADSAYRSTREAADSAYRSVEGVIDAHPVSIAIAGLAAGCLAAAAFPSTRFERETLGPIGRRAAEAASETGELVKSAAVARVTKAAFTAGEQLKEAVAERKFNTDTLGDAARNVASDLSGNVSSDGSESDKGKRQTSSRIAKAQL
jgi:hypothetical protein